MIKIKYNSRVYLRKGTNGVQVRIRWNNKKNEVDTFLGIYAEPEKWDRDLQQARRGTTHRVGTHEAITAREINRTIKDFLDLVDTFFAENTLQGNIPTTTELRGILDKKLGRNPKCSSESPKGLDKNKASLSDAFNVFLKVRPTEVLWGEHSHHKYVQMINHLLACDKNIQLNQIDKNFLGKVKLHFISNGYHNITIQKHFKNIRVLLRWAKNNGYTINDEALMYNANIPSNSKRVIFLKYNELMHFYNYQIASEQNYLSRARDLFCFMASTSLRYSDLKALKKSDIKSDCLEIYTEKTDDMLSIPLTTLAKELLAKYHDIPGDYAFHVPSNAKLNDYIKMAAELAGLDREVTEVYYCGKTKHETINKLYETLSCHDARRTFVCCSLAFGITPTAVMACTGHSDYKAMQPYIDVASETARKEIAKWDKQTNRSKLVEFIDQLSEEQLAQAFQLLQQQFSA